jgi:hypothetical protein
MEFRFVLQGELPGLPEYARAASRERYRLPGLLASVMDRVAWEVPASGRPVFRGRVRFTVFWELGSRRRRFSSVWPGAVLIEEALRGLGVLAPSACVVEHRALYGVDRLFPRAEVLLEDLDGEGVLARPDLDPAPCAPLQDSAGGAEGDGDDGFREGLGLDRREPLP